MGDRDADQPSPPAPAMVSRSAPPARTASSTCPDDRRDPVDAAARSTQLGRGHASAMVGRELVPATVDRADRAWRTSRRGAG